MNISIYKPIINTIVRNLQAAPRFELGVEDLQSTALPLGHAATIKSLFITDLTIVTHYVRILAKKFNSKLMYNVF